MIRTNQKYKTFLKFAPLCKNTKIKKTLKRLIRATQTEVKCKHLFYLKFKLMKNKIIIKYWKFLLKIKL